MDLSDMSWSDSSDCDSIIIGEVDRTMGYDAEKKLRLFEALQQCEEGAGDFACGGQARDLPLPGLFIDGVGLVTLPVLKDQADKIIAVARRAPYGLGEKTLLDERFRKSWQLDATQIQIKNAEFIEAVDVLVEDVKTVLGCNKESVRSVLYKVLLYEEGGHFKAHRDTEKENGMFATLIVQLPSVFEGGNLIVRHAGRETVIQMDGNQTAFGCKYAAHYADCEHELTEIHSGYRLALVYSLCWNASSKVPSTPTGLSMTENLSKILTDFSNDRNGDKFAWLLSHKYTESALEQGGAMALKGRDAAVANALIAANKFLPADDQYVLHVAQVKRHIHQFGDRYAWDIDVKELEDEVEKIRIGNKWYTLDGCVEEILKVWLDPEDEVVNYICPVGTRKDRYNVEFWGEPDKEYNAGRTGNEAATQHYWYKPYAMFAWQKKNTLKVMCSGDLESVVGKVAREVKLVKNLDESNERYQRCMSDMGQIMYFAATEKVRKEALEKRVICPLLDMLSEMKNVALTLRCLTDVLGRIGFKPFTRYSRTTAYGLKNEKMIPKLAHLITVTGWKAVSSSLIGLFQKCPLLQFRRWATLVDQLLEKDGVNRKELIQFRIKIMKKLYVNLGGESWRAMSEQRKTLTELLCIQPWHADFGAIFKKFIKHNVLKTDVDLHCSLINYLENNRDNGPQVRTYIKTLFRYAVEEIEKIAMTKRRESRSAIQSVTKTALLLFHTGGDAMQQRFVNAVLLIPGEDLLKAILRTERTALMETNPHFLKLVNARVQQLGILEKQGPPVLSWCQKGDRHGGPPEVGEFLRGPQESWTKKEFSGIKEARQWVRWNFFLGTQSIDFTVQTGGSGTNAYVVIRKTKTTHNFKMAQYQNNMKELAGFRSLIKKSVDVHGAEPPPKKRALDNKTQD